MFDRRSALAILAAGLAPAFPVLAQPSTGFPSRPVKLIVPYAPGGITDAAARLLGAKLQEKWGQSVLIDNRPGASGGIGAYVASKSAPDGYTLMLAINSMLLAPILDDAGPVHDYEKGAMGPAEADRLTADHGGWVEPLAPPSDRSA